MQASIKWLKEYVQFSDTPEQLAEKMTMAGVAVEHIKYLGEGIDKVITGKVVEMSHHPNAEKLWICKVDVGGTQVTIVTGAQNVNVGDIVPVALVGATLPSGQKIETAELRGIKSEGMLCSTSELDLDPKLLAPDSRNGIYILAQDTPVGVDIKQVLGLDDVILEFELTANRADCFSMLGLAREVAVLTGGTLTMPLLNLEEKGSEKAGALAKISVEEPELCPRFTARILQDVKVGPSPLWLQNKVQAAGMRPINNVVDVTNFVMHEMGQPMHAYDYNLISKHHIIVRRGYDREPLTTLDGNKRELNSEMLVIADQSQAVGLAGVMGGLATEVTNATTMVLLEAASFNNVSIRRTSRAVGLRSEASGRFERGVDTANIIRALDRAANILESIGACKVCPGIIDHYSQIALPRQIKFNAQQINSHLGTSIELTTMIDILQQLGFNIERQGDSHLATVPSWRNDVSGIADLSEEIARIYGFNNIPSTTPVGVMAKGEQSEQNALINTVKEVLTSVGFNEIIAYSFMHPQAFEKLNIETEDYLRQAIGILNPITDEFPMMRTTLWSGVLDTIVRNISRKNEDVKIFEIGSVYLPDQLPLTDFPSEKVKLCGALTGKRNELSWNQPRIDVDFYDIKGTIEAVLEKLGITDYSIQRDNYFCLHPGKTAIIKKGQDVLGVFGEVHPKVLDSYDINRKVFGFEMDVSLLLRYALQTVAYKSLPRFPAISRDLAVVLPTDVSAGDVTQAINDSAGRLLTDISLFDEYRGEQVPEGFKSLAFSLLFRANDKTLTDEEIEVHFNDIVLHLTQKFSASLRV